MLRGIGDFHSHAELFGVTMFDNSDFAKGRAFRRTCRRYAIQLASRFAAEITHSLLLE